MMQSAEVEIKDQSLPQEGNTLQLAAPEDTKPAMPEPVESEEQLSSIWGSWTASATASWKQAVETTGDALEMTGDILTSAAEDAQKLTASVISDEEASGEHENEAETEIDDANNHDVDAPITADALLSSFQLGWSSISSSVVEKTKASLKHAENVVEKSMESLKQVDDYSSNVVEKTKSSIKLVVAEDDGWQEDYSTKPASEQTTENTTAEKSDLVVENLGENDGSETDLFDFR
mmetsp:Transcript_6010/g.12666  ORF Transcript_6010/g.12666 Transcript_6010/m.12666 type:complete len:234 (-) Transcript_6010:156-857(-)